MKLIIVILGKQITLKLVQSEKVIDQAQWADQNTLSENLLPAIDRLLQKNGIRVSQIDDFLVESDQPEGYTTTRIAQVVVDTLKFAKNPNIN